MRGFVHNPRVGSGQLSGEYLLAALDAAGFSTTYCSSKNGKLDEALAQPADIVIVAGGDGTVAKIARNLKDRKTLVAILPSGTANNIARCLGISGDVGELVKSLRGAPVERLDIGVAVGPWGTRQFVEAVGWGALAKAVNRDDPGVSKQSRIKRGRAAFAKTVAKYKPKRVAFTLDGEEFEQEVIFVEVLNLGMTGPRMLIGPTAHHGDQLLDVVYLPPRPSKRCSIGWPQVLMIGLPRLRSGKRAKSTSPGKRGRSVWTTRCSTRRNSPAISSSSSSRRAYASACRGPKTEARALVPGAAIRVLHRECQSGAR